MTENNDNNLHFRPNIVQHAVWLYARFNLNWRDTEDLLAERSIEVSYEAIRRWVARFGPDITRRLPTFKPSAHPHCRSFGMGQIDTSMKCTSRSAAAGDISGGQSTRMAKYSIVRSGDMGNAFGRTEGMPLYFQ